MNDYNFFEQYTRKKRFRINIKPPYLISVAFILIFILLSVVIVKDKMALEEAYLELNEQRLTISLDKRYVESSLLQQKLDVIRQYDQAAETVLKNFQEADLVKSQTLKTLTNALPETVTLKSMSVNNVSANFFFQAPDREVVAELILHLKESNLFQEVTLSSITHDVDNRLHNVSISAIMEVNETK